MIDKRILFYRGNNAERHRDRHRDEQAEQGQLAGCRQT
jgi:hypothetical protein